MEKQKCVLLDTNVWIYSSKMLRSVLGCALLFQLKKNDIKIILPEVVELEVRKHIVKHGNDSIKQIEDGYSVIEKLIGERDNFSLPDKNEFIKAVDKRFAELESLLIREAFSFEDAKNAMLRVMDELAPNRNKNQQFKDSCIWEVIRKNMNEYEIHFITDDNAFFSDKKKNIPHTDFIQEGKELGEEIYFYNSINEYLKIITSENPTIDSEELVSLINNKIDIENLLNLVGDCSSVGDVRDGTVTAYYTEKADELFVQFEVLYTATYQGAEENIERMGFVKAIGETSYNVETKSIGSIDYDKIQLLDNNKNKLNQSVFIRIQANDSNKKQPYTLLMNIDELNLGNQ